MSGTEDFRIVRSTLEAARASCLLGLVRASNDTSITSARSSGVRYFLKNWEEGAGLSPSESARGLRALERPAGLGPAQAAPASTRLPAG